MYICVYILAKSTDVMKLCFLLVCPSVLPFIGLSVCLSVGFSDVYLMICLFVYFFICLSIRLSICLSTSLSFCLSVHKFIFQFIRLLNYFILQKLSLLSMLDCYLFILVRIWQYKDTSSSIPCTYCSFLQSASHSVLQCSLYSSFILFCHTFGLIPLTDNCEIQTVRLSLAFLLKAKGKQTTNAHSYS